MAHCASSLEVLPWNQGTRQPDSSNSDLHRRTRGGGEGGAGGGASRRLLRNKKHESVNRTVFSHHKRLCRMRNMPPFSSPCARRRGGRAAGVTTGRRDYRRRPGGRLRARPPPLPPLPLPITLPIQLVVSWALRRGVAHSRTPAEPRGPPVRDAPQAKPPVAWGNHKSILPCGTTPRCRKTRLPVNCVLYVKS